MEKLRYHPNAIARSLARQRTNTLGLIISRSAEQAFANPFFPEVIRGIGSVAQEHGFAVLLSTSVHEAEERENCLRLIREGRVDGVILSSSRIHDRFIAELEREGFPFVLIGRTFEESRVPWVNNDNVSAARQAVEHLVSLGHRRIGFINGPPDTVVSLDRLEGYRCPWKKAPGAIRFTTARRKMPSCFTGATGFSRLAPTGRTGQAPGMR